MDLEDRREPEEGDEIELEDEPEWAPKEELLEVWLEEDEEELLLREEPEAGAIRRLGMGVKEMVEGVTTSPSAVDSALRSGSEGLEEEDVKDVEEDFPEEFPVSRESVESEGFPSGWLGRMRTLSAFLSNVAMAMCFSLLAS